MNARSLMRRRRRRFLIGISLSLTVVVVATSWNCMAPPTFGPWVVSCTTGYGTVNSTSYQAASYGVKSSHVTAKSEPEPSHIFYSTAPSSVPEPTSLLLMAPAILLLRRRRVNA